MRLNLNDPNLKYYTLLMGSNLFSYFSGKTYDNESRQIAAGTNAASNAFALLSAIPFTGKYGATFAVATNLFKLTSGVPAIAASFQDEVTNKDGETEKRFRLFEFLRASTRCSRDLLQTIDMLDLIKGKNAHNVSKWSKVTAYVVPIFTYTDAIFSQDIFTFCSGIMQTAAARFSDQLKKIKPKLLLKFLRK